MENCISKISKDRFFALEEFMKKKTSFEKGRVRPGLDRLIGGTYTSIYSIKGLSRKRSVCLIANWDVVEKPFFTHPEDRGWFFSHYEIRGWHVCACSVHSFHFLSLLSKSRKPASNKIDRVY